MRLREREGPAFFFHKDCSWKLAKAPEFERVTSTALRLQAKSGDCLQCASRWFEHAPTTPSIFRINQKAEEPDVP